MRATVLSVVMLVGVLAGPAWAQDDYTEFTSAEDRFTVTFPGTPTLTTGFWLTEYGVTLPAKFYTVTDIAGRHTLTVVDYTPVERTLVEKSYNCPLGAETCSGIADTGLGYWKNDFRGATTYAIERLITNRNVTVTHLMFNFMQLVEIGRAHV